MGSKYLSRDAIQAKQDWQYEDVAVPEWGGTVRVRGLSGKERDAFETSVMTITPNGQRRMNFRDMRARLVILCAVDEEGKALFTEPDVKWLTDKSALALQRVFRVAQKLSGFTDEDIEELVEDFDAAPPAPSSSS